MWTREASAAVLALAVAGMAQNAAAQAGDPLYACLSDQDTRVVDIGATVCDAAPTATLTARMEEDNLQLREGAFVTEVANGGLAQTAGLAPGDVIYRVGGVDVGDTVITAARLSLIAADTDTVVNFLRRGRPYRVKLRRP